MSYTDALLSPQGLSLSRIADMYAQVVVNGLDDDGHVEPQLTALLLALVAAAVPRRDDGAEMETRLRHVAHAWVKGSLADLPIEPALMFADRYRTLGEAFNGPELREHFLDIQACSQRALRSALLRAVDAFIMFVATDGQSGLRLAVGHRGIITYRPGKGLPA